MNWDGFRLYMQQAYDAADKDPNQSFNSVRIMERGHLNVDAARYINFAYSDGLIVPRSNERWGFTAKGIRFVSPPPDAESPKPSPGSQANLANLTNSNVQIIFGNGNQSISGERGSE